MRLGPRHFDFKFCSPNFHLQIGRNCSRNCETLTVNNIKAQKMKKQHIPEMGKRKCCFVSVYLPVFMFTCYPLSSILLYFDHFSRQSFYIHQQDSTSCYCAPAGVSETTSWRNWSTNCNRLHGIPNRRY